MSMHDRERPFQVIAPATSANLGSGFDVAGMALDWWDKIKVTPREGPRKDLQFRAEGEGSTTLPAGRDNILIEALMRLAEEVGRECPAITIELELDFPLGRGFGSSATGISLGLVAGRELLAPEMSDAEMFELASLIEGHPDNVAPCLFGGATLCWIESGRPHYHSMAVHPDLSALAFISADSMATKTARRILPDSVPFKHATWTAGRTALLPLALDGAFDLLLPATDDVLHQKVRLANRPDILEVLGLLRKRGHAAFVSGAGPSLLVLYEEDRSARVHEDARELCQRLPGWRLQKLGVQRGVGTRAVDSAC